MVHNEELNSDLEWLVASIFNVLVKMLGEADKSPYYHIGLSNKKSLPVGWPGINILWGE